MAETKKKTTTKAKPKPAPVLSVAEAADLLGVTPQELLLSRAKGMTPGSLGYRVDGVLVFDRAAIADDGA